jgi:plasmid stabilization system protein ParE
MTAEQGFKLHPGAASDITSIWEFIAKDNPLAARRVREDILDAIRKLVPFPHQGHQRRDLTARPVRFQTVRNYLLSPTHPTKSRFLYSPCSMVAEAPG